MGRKEGREVKWRGKGGGGRGGLVVEDEMAKVLVHVGFGQEVPIPGQQQECLRMQPLTSTSVVSQTHMRATSYHAHKRPW